MYFWRGRILWNRAWLMWEGLKLVTWQVRRRGLPGIVTGATWKPLWLLLYIANYWLHSFTVSSGVLCDSSYKHSSSRTQDFGFAQLVCRLCSYHSCLWSYLCFYHIYVYLSHSCLCSYLCHVDWRSSFSLLIHHLAWPWEWNLLSSYEINQGKKTFCVYFCCNGRSPARWFLLLTNFPPLKWADICVIGSQIYLEQKTYSTLAGIFSQKFWISFCRSMRWANIVQMICIFIYRCDPNWIATEHEQPNRLVILMHKKFPSFLLRFDKLMTWSGQKWPLEKGLELLEILKGASLLLLTVSHLAFFP